MPFPSTSPDLMASAMGGSILTSSSGASAPSTSPSTSPSSCVSTSKPTNDATSVAGNGTVRIFYSLKENPNAIISYSDLIRQEQRRQRAVQLPPAKNGGNATTSSASAAGATLNPTGSSFQSTSAPLKISKVTGTATGNKDGGATSQSSATNMDIDPPEGEEALVDGDSEAEDDDEEDDDDEDNEDGTEAEDEDDDDDPDEEEDEEDDPESGRREPKDFLEALTAKYAGLEEGNEGEDEDEDEDDDDKEKVYKRPSRWDTEHYDVEDEFIDDSEMMLESIGMVRPKVDGFFAYRGPVETTNEDPDSSDAAPRSRKTAKRKPAAGSSPLSTGKGGALKSAKGSSLAVMENANDSTSELSEMDDKPKTTKSSSASSGLANSSTPNDAPVASGGVEAGINNAAVTPTKKKTVPSKSKAAVKDVNKDGAETGKDSDKESKAGLNKKAKAKPTKAAASSVAVATAPVVRVDSPPPLDDNGDNSTPPPPPSRSPSPSRPKSKPKVTTATEVGSAAATDSSESTEVQTSTSVAPEIASPANELSKASTKSSSTQSEGAVKSKGSKALEPLNDEVQAAFNIVADLAKEETWEVKTRFPVNIKAPLFACSRIALATRSSGYVLDDNFFFHLQAVLPYNKFTLKKLIYKNVLPGWILELETQKTRLIEQVTMRASMIWKTSGLANLEKNRPEKDGDGDVNMNSEEGKPQKKFPWSQDLRLLLWETMEKFMEILAARQELHAVDENQPLAPTDSKTRKDAYQTLLLSFPPGWMTSYEISRQYSQLKEKVQKQEKKGETELVAPVGKLRPLLPNNGSKSGSTGTAARSASAQPSGTSTTDKQPAPTADSSNTAPASSPTMVATSAHPSHVDAPRESMQRSSPSMSPSAVNRTVHLSEIVHSAPIPPTANKGTSASGRKRKKPEEAVQAHGAGSSNDPVVIGESQPDDDEPMNPPDYRSNVGGNGSDYKPPPSLSPSTSPANQAIYSSNESVKKKKVTDQKSASTLPIGHHSGPAPSSSYQQGSREPLYQSHRPPSPPPQSHSSLPPVRGFAPPSSQQMTQQPSSRVNYHEPLPQHHHRVVSPGGSPYGSSTHPSSSRPPPPSQPASATKAMSMSNLLHHPHTSQQQQQHSRQGPM